LYCEDVEVAGVHSGEEPDTDVLALTPGTFGVMPYAIDPDNARQLWKLSEELLRP
jgi:hypothetical protein